MDGQPHPPTRLYLILRCHFQASVFSLMHTGKLMGVAVSHCITWFHTQLIFSACQIRYHSHLWDHCRTGLL